MNTEPVIPDFVYTLWGVTLVVGYLLLPVAVYWLHSLWRAAASIRRYARDGVVAAEGIARGTAALPALDTTIALATEVLGAAERVAGKLEAVAGVMETRAGHRS
ncbi:hypothetical protein BH23ACI1_BH23ACI1_30210 [soil metagenome]